MEYFIDAVGKRFADSFLYFKTIDESTLVVVEDLFKGGHKSERFKRELDDMAKVEDNYSRILTFSYFEIKIIIKDGILRELKIDYSGEGINFIMDFTAHYFFAKKFLGEFWEELESYE
ncbi:MAG: hypothetical protein KAQ89_06160 [Planctomycetes bacterium]|nr:hypothetical protein [Planctomycetota bacterium]